MPTAHLNGIDVLAAADAGAVEVVELEDLAAWLALGTIGRRTTD